MSNNVHLLEAAERLLETYKPADTEYRWHTLKANSPESAKKLQSHFDSQKKINRRGFTAINHNSGVHIAMYDKSPENVSNIVKDHLKKHLGMEEGKHYTIEHKGRNPIG
jgi:hypothetical protein